MADNTPEIEDEPSIPPDQHGNVPRFQDARSQRSSPTTYADVLAWCIAQRDHEHVLLTLTGVAFGSLPDSLKAVTERDSEHFTLHGFPYKVLEAASAAARDIYGLVDEFSYDPTSDERYAFYCRGILIEHLNAIHAKEDESHRVDSGTTQLEELRTDLHLAALSAQVQRRELLRMDISPRAALRIADKNIGNGSLEDDRMFGYMTDYILIRVAARRAFQLARGGVRRFRDMRAKQNAS